MDVENYDRDFPQEAPMPFLFTATPDMIRRAANEAIDAYQSAVDKLINETLPETATFLSFLEPLGDADSVLVWANSILQVYELSSDAVVRKAVDEVDKLFGDLKAKTMMRHDLFSRVDAVYKNETWLNKPLSTEQTRFLATLHEQLIAHGAALPLGSPERQRLLSVHQRRNNIKDQFEDNLADHKPQQLWLTEDKCEGLPPSVWSSAPEGTTDETRGRRSIPLRAVVIENARHEHVRRQLFGIWAEPCRTNAPLFVETMKLNREAAKIVGFSHYVALVMQQQQRMAKTVEAVDSTLVSLLQKVQPLAEMAARQLLECKRAELANCADDGYEDDDSEHLYDWDVAYYQRQLAYERTGITPDEIKNYLPLEHVLDGVLDIVSELYGLSFQEILRQPNDNLAWHEDVRILSVRDKVEFDGGFVGHIYLDLFRREGKQRGIWCRDISRLTAVLVCDFVKPLDGTSHFLSHDQPVQFLHELGHAVHHVVSRTRYARFHGGSGTPVDFGETQGVLLEKLFHLNEAGIRRLTRHCSTDTPAPDRIIEAILTYQKVYRGPLFHLDQLIMAKFDLDSHLSPAADPNELFHSLRSTYCQRCTRVDRPAIPAQHDYTKNGRLFTEYAAGHYAYCWADIYASDIFDSFWKSKTDTSQGYHYRKTVLQKGGSIDGTKLFHEYLGREVQVNAMYNNIRSSVLR
ncbi:metalloendopeptidase [Sporothrix eucalyptigena]|uniref:Metalloendopeptidase n=1 Tax=Sporothrix eucalyptigena TaxID=1812306 RepID=A0ABP0CVJ5_9PEZI